MSIRPYGILAAVVVTGLVCVRPERLAAQAAAQPAQPQYQNQQEYTLYDAILKDTNPKTKLEKIQEWEKQFPTTNFTKERKQLYFTTYVALSMPKEIVASAKKILTDDPKDFNANYYTMLLTRQLYTGTETSVLDDGEKASQTLLAGLDTPPPGVAADQWAKLRPDLEVLAHVTLGFVNNQRKNWDGAEAELKKALGVNPNNSEVDYMLYFTMANKKNPSAALFYQARAAAYDGPGSLNAQQRQGVMAEVQKAYTAYHGADGFNDLLAAAKSSPNPPEGFKIKSKGEIAKEKYAADAAGEAKFEQEHPEWARWKKIKEALSGADGANYFTTGMKDAKVPTMMAKVVKLEPAVKPKTILVSMEDGASDGTTADATLKFDAPLPGKVDVGTELTFEGVGESFTPSPLMVVFTVDKADLHGWTGKNTPAGPVHRPAPKKK